MRSRADVVAALKEAGLEVPRQGKSYVTAHDPESGQRWRLKGALYERDFDPERLDRPAAVEVGDRPAGDRADRRGEAERQAAENRTLRQLVEHFGGQVTPLTADLRTLGETFRRPRN